MKKIIKIVFIILIILITLIFIIVWKFYYQEYFTIKNVNIENKEKLFEIINVLKNTDIRFIEVVDDKLKFYNTDRNLVDSKIENNREILWIMKNNNIVKTFYHIYKPNNKNNEIDYIYFEFYDKDFYLVYNNENQKLNVWDIIRVTKIKKIIDKNWFISQECNRNICSENELYSN